MQSNGIPSFAFDRVTPNALTEQDWNWELPGYPEPAPSSSEVPLGGPAAVSVDGLPIFGPWLCEDDGCQNVIELESSYQQVEDEYGTTIENAWDAHEYVEGLRDLDECNGLELEDGGYAYFATPNFPYFIGCYRGEPRNQGFP